MYSTSWRQIHSSISSPFLVAGVNIGLGVDGSGGIEIGEGVGVGGSGASEGWISVVGGEHSRIVGLEGKVVSMGDTGG